MKRRHLTFAVEGLSCHATLDEADGPVGLLLVSGGNEIRSGAHSGQARLAAQIARGGFPVFRFDRRGVGDSEGENHGFRSSGPDVAAGLEEFRHQCPALRRIIAFGNCDAASALMLQSGAGLAALVLANPWTFDSDSDDTMPPGAVRARYADKLRNPQEWKRLLHGKVSLRRLAGGLRSAVQPAPPPSSLVQDMRAGLSGFTGAVHFLLAGRDRTAQAFRSAWGADGRIALREGADHAFSATDDQAWLVERLLSALHEQAGQLDMG